MKNFIKHSYTPAKAALEFENANSNVIKAGSKTAVASTEAGLIWNAGSVPQYTCKISWEKMVPKY